MKYWTMRTGERIKLTDMDDRHLENTIRMVGRQIDSYPGDQAYMGDSDFAEEAVESENRINRERLDGLMNAYSSLKREQVRRQPRLTPVISKEEVAKFRNSDDQ